ncbi:MAG: GNAT family N-acetyltransferase [Xanthomonadaceae bacterium]|nr:GNAT family N-acetyltransferase [Xanthomonadaceae bacterium]MBS3959530.1 GNAT family N-acetyltransferase [Xanthomonadaceae bacterium]
MIHAEFRVEPADYGVDFADLRAVREPVFVVEQQVPIEEEWDELDPHCRHVIARDAQDRPIGTGRLTPERKIGRMAVLPEWRGRGVGAAILLALLDEARARGWPEVSLNAQTHALPFYAAHGFEAYGEEFLEAGIPHRRMRKSLDAPDPGRRPRPPRSGDTQLREIASETDVRMHSAGVIARARREVRLFTRDLEATLYGHPELVEALREFATSGRGPLVRILVVETDRLRAEGHALLLLAQRLSSVFALRTPVDPEDRQAPESYLVADETAYVFRPLATRFEGSACLDGPARARQLAEAFDRRWERARPLSELRAL